MNQLKSLDKGFQIFGTSSHKYKFNNPISKKELEEFENYYDIILPEEYREFICELGNGGAGPYYGIKKLQDSIVEYHREDKNYLKEDFPHKENWNWSSKLFEIFDFLRGNGTGELNDYYHKKYLLVSEYEVDKEEWEAIKLFSGNINSEIADFFENVYWREYFSKDIDKGSIDVCEYGCALRFKLIVTGEERGNIWFDERPDTMGISPVKNKVDKKMSFYEWYTSWLDDSIEEILKQK